MTLLSSPSARERRDPVVRICDVCLRACAVAAVWASGFDIAHDKIALGLAMLLVGAVAWEASRV